MFQLFLSQEVLKKEEAKINASSNAHINSNIMGSTN